MTGPVRFGNGGVWRWRWHAPGCYSMAFNMTARPATVKYFLGEADGRATDALPVAVGERYSGSPFGGARQPFGRSPRPAPAEPPPQGDRPKFVPYSPPPPPPRADERHLSPGASVALVLVAFACVGIVMMALVPPMRTAAHNCIFGGVRNAANRRRGFDRLPVDDDAGTPTPTPAPALRAAYGDWVDEPDDAGCTPAVVSSADVSPAEAGAMGVDDDDEGTSVAVV